MNHTYKQRFIEKIIFLAIILYIFPIKANAIDEFSTCETNKSQQFGNYIITNNAWGINRLKGDRSLSMLCIKGSAVQEKNVAMSAIWNLGESPNYVLAYPMISYGVWGWSHQPQPENLPNKIKKFTKIESNVVYKIKSESSFNVSYDIWFSDRENPNKENIKVELMIWTDCQASGEPPGKKIGTIQLAEDIYDIYKGTVKTGNWVYIALVINYINKSSIVKSMHETIKHEIQSSKYLDIKKVIDHLVDIKLIDNNLFLNSISFGSEIMGGVGIIKIESFQVQLTTNEILKD